ncbi:MAG TPA: capsule assembly Wzi family protein [Longimicrobium sp.]
MRAMRGVGAGSLLFVLSVSGHDSLHSQALPVTADSAARALAPARSAHPPHAASASPLLPAGHWAVRAAERAGALGLAPGWFPAQDAAPRGAVLDALEEAAEAVEAGGAISPRMAALARGWVDRFREEFPEYGDDADGDALLLSVNGHAAAGYAGERGRLSPAVGYFDSRRDPQPVPEVSTARLDASGGVRAGRHAAVWALGRWDDEGVDLARWEAVAQAGPLALSAGKQTVGYGWSEGGGVALGSALLPRVEVQTARPLRLPGFLRLAGPVAGHLFVSRAGGTRHPDSPWLWGARVAFRPHARVSFAVNRASLFGGAEEVTAERVLKMLVGAIRGSTFENQVLSFEGRWRLPTEGVLPATAYLEWGADDGAGALNETPGRVAGVLFPALPGAPEVAAGAEYARFAEACCGHGPWYFNFSFPGNWARGSHALGHPLGGEGWEAAGFARAELLDARLRVDARGFVRDRSDASYAHFGGGNLYAPARTGRSTGVQGGFSYRLRPHVELRARGRAEAGDGWSEAALDAQLALFF